MPVSGNYPSPLVAIPSLLKAEEPREGRKQIPVKIDWASMGAVDSSGMIKTVTFNIQNNTYVEFSTIASIWVDNSQCGGPVSFNFPDIQQTIVVPAYAPYTLVPVITGAKAFTVANVNVGADVTVFQILNYVPPPAEISSGIISRPVSTAQLVPFTIGTTAVTDFHIAGTINSVSISAAWQTAAADFLGRIDVQTAAGVVLFTAPVAGKAGTSFSGILAAEGDKDIRYTGGQLKLVISGGDPGGAGLNGSVVLNMSGPYP